MASVTEPLDILKCLRDAHVLQEADTGLLGELSREFVAHDPAISTGEKRAHEYPYLPTLHRLSTLSGHPHFKGLAAVCMHLVEHGADAQESAGWLWQVFEYRRSYFRRFIQLGADANAVYMEQTALHRAATQGWAEESRLLIAAGADVEQAGKDAASPFYRAAFCGHAEVCSLLLQSGARPHLWTPLHSAALLGDAAQVRQLLAAGAAADAEDADACTPLHYAAGQGHAEIVRALLAAGADTHGRHHFTPLYLAVRGGWHEVCLTLLDAGADTEGRHPETPLLLAARKLHAAHCENKHAMQKTAYTEICSTLIHRGANARAADIIGLTPLHWIARSCDVAVAKLFIESGGAALNARDCMGDTPLHLAADNKNKPLYDYLVSLGADEESRNAQGLTPRDVWEGIPPDARSSFLGRLRADFVLEEKEKFPEHALLAREFAQHFELYLAGRETIRDFPYIAHLLRIGNKGLRWIKASFVQELIDWGADVNMPILPEQNAPLHEVFLGDDTQICRALLAAGADANARNLAGQTPLHLAALSESPEVYALLVSAGADELARDGEGNTPRDSAQARPEPDAPYPPRAAALYTWEEEEK